ncbi:MAG: penicillin-insensitive murein endopeptidase [Solirubrobacterales bacterium]
MPERLRIATCTLALGLLLCTAAVAPAQTPPPDGQFTPVVYQPSRAKGTPQHGRLIGGVQLPEQGPDFFTWDSIYGLSPNRPWRRWGTGRLIALTLRVAGDYRLANTGAPRIGIEDISRPRGGNFGPRYGGLGHASHQNGLDVDIAYPRLDRQELGIGAPWQIDRLLAQDLVDRFEAAGAEYIFVGPHTGLDTSGPVVQRLASHDDHMHVRIPKGLRSTAPTA